MRHGVGSTRALNDWEMVVGSPGEASTRRTHRLASGSRRGELDGSNDHAKRLAAARIRAPGEDPCVLIIGDSTNPASQRHFASQTPAAVTVEALDLRDLVSFARRFGLRAPAALDQLARFALGGMANGCAATFLARCPAR